MNTDFLQAIRNRLLFFFASFTFLLLCNYQLGANPPPQSSAAPEKCIFYWGKIQCNLLLADNYISSIEVSAAVFRESVFSMPCLWDGKSVRDTLTFQLEDQPIECFRGQKEKYQAYQALLDQKFAQSAQPGSVFLITNLSWGIDHIGSIRLVITENKPGGFNMRRFPGIDRPILITKEWIDHFKWGPFIDEWMDRDYYTVKEVMATIEAEPVYVWNPYKVPDGLEVQMGPLMTDVEIPMQVADLTGVPYTIFSANFIHSYGHLIEPGMAMEFSLRTAQQRHPEMRAIMQVVADDDPRLKLRRSKDGHQFELKWAGRTSNWDHLYLKTIQTPSGKTVNTDPETRLSVNYSRTMYSAPQSEWKTVVQQNYDLFLHSRPSIKVDEIDIDHFSFDIEVVNTTWTIGPDENLPATLVSILEESAQKGERAVLIVIKNIRGSDLFNFAPISFDCFLPLPIPIP